MNVITRIAQGINITINLNDILEMIYAQTLQIIPADDFQIILLGEEGDTLFRLFCVEMNERLPHLENKNLSATVLLEQEVINQHRAIRTIEYARECQTRNIPAARYDIYAWMGVPLNSGAETFGSLSLAKRDPSVIYTQEQQNLLQSIADLVAGAISKARLLDESQQRASQLSSLNDLSRQLTSMLNMENLLKYVLQSAVDILDCEAGSLLLVDEETEELVFRVVIGPVAGELLNHRMPMGTGLVGKAVKNRTPLIVNDVKEESEWSSRNDQDTGFFTQSLLVIPMEAKEKAIGVLEVINKKDGSPFKRQDQQLLMAFTAQAAIALENARLYTNTDQALEARIEELSVLQRIGRELNTSLETGRAMSTTLDWAMRKSNATAGLVGVVEGDGIRVMSYQGFTSELEPYKEKRMPLTLFNLEEILEKGVPFRRTLSAETQPGLLASSHNQTIIPIRRETTTIGLLLLESTAMGVISDETLNFLQRLTDHAAIAISNAQLYTVVKAANVAKSEFVSFVSHELKNPMTSIKGYTELLLVGAVGAVTDAQQNFLKTIQANVDRMSTLVSDLNDDSRIEAGRLRLDYVANPPRDVIDEVTRSLRRQIDDKKLQYQVQLPENIPAVWADRTRLIQVITNLVSNACKYTPESGSVLVTAQASENLWDPEGGAARVVHFWVQDTGLGISPEDQKKIFQKFFRAEDPRAREVPGTGLGLNITRSLVELQGGKIWFESEYRKGTTFHFTIPVAEGEEGKSL